MSHVSLSIPGGRQGENGLERTSQIFERLRVSPGPSRRRLRKVEFIECVRLRRQSGGQNVGFSSRPFVLCGLPIKCPPPGTLVHERRNGQFVLLVTGHPNYGLPWGQDRLVPLFLATLATRQQTRRITFPSAAERLILHDSNRQMHLVDVGFGAG